MPGQGRAVERPFISAERSAMIKDLPPAAALIGDQRYDRDKIRKVLAEQGISSCIPPRRCRKKPVHWGLCSKVPRLRNLFSTSFFPTRTAKTGV